MKAVKNCVSYNNFVSDENGIETIEFLALLGVAAMLVVVIVSVFIHVQKSADIAVEKISEAVDSVSSLS